MILKKTIIAVAVLVGFATISAQQQSLLDEEKADAIFLGSREKGRLTGLSLTDVGRLWTNAIIAAGDRYAQTVGTGFSLRIYTPYTWIEQQASNAAKEYRPFTVRDITAEMLEPVLRVYVYPDKPTSLTGYGMSLASSVQHVVIRDVGKSLVLQPLTKEPFTDTASSALRDMAYQGIVTKFPLSALADLRASSSKKEFLIIIVGEGTQERVYTVKEKHFPALTGITRFSVGPTSPSGSTGPATPRIPADGPPSSPTTVLTTPTDRNLEPLEFLNGHAVLKFDPSEWKRFTTTDPKNMQLVHLSGEVYFRVITDPESSGAKDERLIQQGPRTINGIRVVCMETEATIAGVPYVYYTFKYSGPIGTIQLTGFATRALMEKYRGSVERLASGFEFTGR